MFAIEHTLVRIMLGIGKAVAEEAVFGQNGPTSERDLSVQCAHFFQRLTRHEIQVHLHDGDIRWGLRSLKDLVALYGEGKTIVRVVRLSSSEIDKVIPYIG